MCVFFHCRPIRHFNVALHNSNAAVRCTVYTNYVWTFDMGVFIAFDFSKINFFSIRRIEFVRKIMELKLNLE